MGNDEILEFAIGLQKDPSWDHLLATMPKDAKKKLGGGFSDTFKGIEQSGMAMLRRLGGFAASALGIGGIAGLGMRAFQVANIEVATKRLVRAGELNTEQEKDLRKAVSDTATETGIGRDIQLNALQSLQDKYAVVNKWAQDGTLPQQIELAGKMTNAFGGEIDGVLALMGGLSSLAGLMGDDVTAAMAYMEQASHSGAMGFGELKMAITDVLGETKSLGQGGLEAVRTSTALLETVSKFYPESMERVRTYTRQMVASLSKAPVQDKLAKQLGVGIDRSKSLYENINAVLDALSGVEDPTRAMYEIFGSEEAVNAWKALLTERGTFENIINVEAGSEGFMKFLNEQNNETASNMKKLKEKFLSLIDQTVLTEGTMLLLNEGMEYLSTSITSVGTFLGDVKKEWSDILGLDKKDKRTDEELANDSGAARARHKGSAWTEAEQATMSVAEHKHGRVLTPQMAAFLKWYAQQAGMEKESQVDVFKHARRTMSIDENKRNLYTELYAGDIKQGKFDPAQAVMTDEQIDKLAKAVEAGAEKGASKAQPKMVTKQGGPPADTTVLNP
jgi:hypothetical protein